MSTTSAEGLNWPPPTTAIVGFDVEAINAETADHSHVDAGVFEQRFMVLARASEGKLAFGWFWLSAARTTAITLTVSCSEPATTVPAVSNCQAIESDLSWSAMYGTDPTMATQATSAPKVWLLPYREEMKSAMEPMFSRRAAAVIRLQMGNKTTIPTMGPR